ncbi:hypothetical protein BC829DRAFT_427919 [Chytridium lagenaria]|nr:hypothetical protein BC829DRAFT_427919 [Chytridium lagenaria]
MINIPEDTSPASVVAAAATPKADSFREPTKAILSKEDLERWQTSDTYNEYMGFVERLNASVKNTPLSTKVMESEEGKSRFGNPAFQTWFDRLSEVSCSTLDLLAAEVSAYLLHSFGNRKRIDYGTGHEAHFIAFPVSFLCIEKLGLITPEDHPGLVLRVFWKYIGVMRSLQFKYWLEPAGSHGVWGLDDYHFLPFMFGSSQLSDHKYLKPKCVHDQEIIEEFSKDYMYLACIKFINSVKSASLRWHSPMLDDISGVKLWSKVNSGMVKMYKGEWSPPSEHDELAHVHAFGQMHPECCGIRVPSSIAAAAQDGNGDARNAWSEFGVKGAMVGGALGGRRPGPIPFD